jgi:hypothetical protein
MSWGVIRSRRRAVTLIEAMIVVVVLALAVPPMLAMTADVVDARVESVRISEATALAQGIAEHVLADVHATSDSTGEPVGLGAMADSAAYMDHPASGLRARLAWIAEPYESRGITWSVEIGELCNADGHATGDAGADLYRRVRVLVSFVGSRGRMQVAVTLVVGGGI